VRLDLASHALRAVVRVMGERDPETGDSKPITYSRGQSVSQIGGVFQASYVGLDPETGVEVRSTQPVLLVDGSELPFAPRQNDQVTARGVTYRVRDPQPDGHGGWLLMLHRVSVLPNVFVDGVFVEGVFA
jgi:hypothetical protein